jgi:predicted AAA+ superfamily ATPase
MKNRDIYLNNLLKHKDKGVIKVITGIRRCGKSTLLKLFADKLSSSGVSEKNIIQMNFESLEFDDIKDYKALYNCIKSRIYKKTKTYIILDEIQTVEKWEKAVNSMLVDFNADIYITGSNAFLLSSELSTLLSGRYVEIKMLPLSFIEFLDFNTFERNSSDEDKFDLYLRYGGMPIVAEYSFDRERINEILSGIYSTVILKDVVERNKILDVALLKRVALFLADNIGNNTSVNNIANYLISEKQLNSSVKKGKIWRTKL